jgi:tetratricopeptide (TPR) repeat protein
MDKLPEAEELLLRALERAKRDPAIHDHLGDVYSRQGRLKEAIGQWQSALQAWQTAARSEVDPAEVAKVQKKLESAKIRLAKEAAPASSPVKPQ